MDVLKAGLRSTAIVVLLGLTLTGAAVRTTQAPTTTVTPQPPVMHQLWTTALPTQANSESGYTFNGMSYIGGDQVAVSLSQYSPTNSTVVVLNAWAGDVIASEWSIGAISLSTIDHNQYILTAMTVSTANQWNPLVMLDAATLEKKWTSPTVEMSFPPNYNAPVYSKADGLIYGTATIQNEYFVTGLAVNATTGEVAWSLDWMCWLTGAFPDAGIAFAINTTNSSAESSATVTTYALKSGEELYSFQLPMPEGDLVTWTGHGPMMYFLAAGPFSGNSIAVLHAANGTLAFKIGFFDGFGFSAIVSDVQDSLGFFACVYSTATGQMGIAAVSWKGAVQWTTLSNGSSCSAVAFDAMHRHVVYVVGSNAATAIDRRTGEILARTLTQPGTGEASPTVVGVERGAVVYWPPAIGQNITITAFTLPR